MESNNQRHLIRSGNGNGFNNNGRVDFECEQTLHGYKCSRHEKILQFGIVTLIGSVPADKCLQMLTFVLNYRGVDINESVVAETTDGVAVIKKMDE